MRCCTGRLGGVEVAVIAVLRPWLSSIYLKGSSMTEEQDNRSKKTDLFLKLIDNGAEIAGGAVSGALGLLAGDPVGAATLGAGGSVAAIMLKHVGQEVPSGS